MNQTMLSAELATNLLHGGFALSTLAFLLRDMLHLRLVALISYLVFSAAVLVRGGDSVTQLLPWYVAFLAINGTQAAWLIYERRLQRMSPREQALFDLAFRGLDRVLVRKLIRRGKWMDIRAGERLTRQRILSTHVFIIVKGEVEIVSDGQRVAALEAGQFVGEIGFVANTPAGANAIAATPVRCIAWNVLDLRQAVTRDERLRAVLYAALGADLARKIGNHNVRLARPVAEPQPNAVGGSAPQPAL